MRASGASSTHTPPLDRSLTNVNIRLMGQARNSTLTKSLYSKHDVKTLALCFLLDQNLCIPNAIEKTALALSFLLDLKEMACELKSLFTTIQGTCEFNCDVV